MDSVIDVESDELEARTLATVLADEYRVLHCPDIDLALALIESEKPAALLFDLREDRMAESLCMISRLSRGEGRPPLLAMCPGEDPHTAVLAIRHGASDCIAKPIRLDRLKSALRALALPPLESPFIGMSGTIRKIDGLVKDFARYDYPVLILGESGTGKELAARAIHRYSARAKEAFVPRNCAAIPEDLIESELFGSSRGAFTGAVERPGAFELANGGTLFLDEIGDAARPVQVKLLRVLESGEVWRLADCKPRKIKVRLVSATSAKLWDSVQAGGFRKDLYYRINTLVLELPPLRERREDIPELANYFVRMAEGPRKRLSDCALERLADESWPGNIRELRNVLHRAIVLSGEREVIDEEHIVIY